MPLPTPAPDEEHDEFIQRCMGDDTMTREYPDTEQRLAVCETQWRRQDSLQERMRARLMLHNRRRDWYRIDDATEGEATIYIYDEIGYWGTTAKEFVNDLSGITAHRIALHLNTPGGDVWDGIAIHNALRAHPATVTVTIDSLAASIGSVIAMAGDRVVMARHSTLMIHDPYTLAFGDAEEMRKVATILDQLGDTIAGIYAERAGGSVREWRERMLTETWYTDREAVEAGLADEVDGDAAADATPSNQFDLTLFKHPPEHLLGEAAAGLDRRRPPTKRDIERALRDAGLSRTQAKAFIAAAWRGPEPDEETRDVSDLIALRDALAALVT